MSGVGVFLHACPVDFSTAVTAAAAPKARFSHDPSFFFSFLLSATHMLSSLPSAVTADLNNKSLLKYFVYQNLKKTEVLKNPEGKSAMCSSRSSMYDCVSETTETHQMSH